MWVRLSDTLAQEDWVERAGLEALGLLVAALCHHNLISDQRSWGYLLHGRLEKLAGGRGKKADGLIAALVKEGLLSDEWRDGYQVYRIADRLLELQKDPDTVRTWKAKRAERQRKWRENKKRRERGATVDDLHDGLHDDLQDAPQDRSVATSRNGVPRPRPRPRKQEEKRGAPDGVVGLPADPSPSAFTHDGSVAEPIESTRAPATQEDRST